MHKFDAALWHEYFSTWIQLAMDGRASEGNCTAWVSQSTEQLTGKGADFHQAEVDILGKLGCM